MDIDQSLTDCFTVKGFLEVQQENVLNVHHGLNNTFRKWLKLLVKDISAQNYNKLIVKDTSVAQNYKERRQLLLSYSKRSVER